MKYRLRHITTKKWLTHSGQWTDDPEAALQFASFTEANAFRVDCGIPKVEVDPPSDEPSLGTPPRSRW